MDEEHASVKFTDELWFEKYRPRIMDEMIVDRTVVDSIRRWFKQYQEMTAEYRSLLFTGPPGIGKTSMAHIILGELGYTAIEFNASDIRSKSLVNANMFNLMRTRTLNDQKIGIIMDEVDGMSKGDRGGLEELKSFIVPEKITKKNSSASTGSKIWGPPVICICNIGTNKKTTIATLRTFCQEITFNLPNREQMFQVIDRVAQSENLKFESETTTDLIYEYSQSDFRRLMCLLQHLAERFGTYITTSNVEDSYEIFCKKEQDLHVVDSVKRVLNHQLDYNSIMAIYQKDKSKAPMVMHENYIKAIDLQQTTFIKKINNAMNCISSIVDSDIIEKTMFNTQAWHLQPVQGILCCYIPSFYLNNVPKKRQVEASWAEVLGKNSHAQNDKKNIYELIVQINHHNSYTISEIQLLSEIILYNLVTPDHEEIGVKLAVNYNLDFNNIKDLVRTAKITQFGAKWEKTKNKTKIKKLFEMHMKSDVIEKPTVKKIIAPANPVVAPKINVVIKSKSTATVTTTSTATTPTTATSAPTTATSTATTPTTATSAPTTATSAPAHPTRPTSVKPITSTPLKERKLVVVKKKSLPDE